MPTTITIALLVLALVAVLLCFFLISYKGKCGGDVERGNLPQPTTRTPVATPGLRNFAFEELETATGGFSKEKHLGEGGFGDVFQGILPDDSIVAVKKLKPGSKQGNKEFQAEIKSIGRIHHWNLVPLIGFCVDSQNKLLVYQFIDNKSLHSHLHGTPRIIHRDIKAANVLLDLNFEPKVADFGLAKLFPDNHTHVSTCQIKGTQGYLALEYVQTWQLTDKIDVYAFGVLLLELITGKRPLNEECYKGKTIAAWAMSLLDRALRNENYDIIVDPNLNNDYDRVEVKRMMRCARACIRTNPENRPKMSVVVDTLEGKDSPNI